MVLLHVKRGDESQFLLQAPGSTELEELTVQVTRVYNARLKVQRVCSGAGRDRGAEPGLGGEEETGPFGMEEVGWNPQGFLGPARVKLVEICIDGQQLGLKWDTGVRRRRREGRRLAWRRDGRGLERAMPGQTDGNGRGRGKHPEEAKPSGRRAGAVELNRCEASRSLAPVPLKGGFTTWSLLKWSGLWCGAYPGTAP